MDLTEHLRALAVYRDTYLGHPDAERITEGALWAFARVSGESMEVLRSRMVDSRPVAPRTGPLGEAQQMIDDGRGLRLYAPSTAGVALVVTREAESNTVVPGAPIAAPNPRSFSDLSAEPTPLNDEDRAYLDSLPQPDPDDVARQVAAMKAQSSHLR